MDVVSVGWGWKQPALSSHGAAFKSQLALATVGHCVSETSSLQLGRRPLNGRRCWKEQRCAKKQAKFILPRRPPAIAMLNT